MDDSDAEDGEQQQQRQQQQAAAQQAAAPAREEQQEGEVAAATSRTAAAAGAPSAGERQQRVAVAPPAPPAAAAEPDMGQAWKMGLGGVVALAAFAGLGFLGHRLFKSKAVSSAVTNVQQVGGHARGSRGPEWCCALVRAAGCGLQLQGSGMRGGQRSSQARQSACFLLAHRGATAPAHCCRH